MSENDKRGPRETQAFGEEPTELAVPVFKPAVPAVPAALVVPAVASHDRATMDYRLDKSQPSVEIYDAPESAARALPVDEGPVLGFAFRETREAEVPVMTAPGIGASHCPVCGALVMHQPRCSECDYAFEDPRVGQIISGRYQVNELIGAGGFGRVYRGTHLTLGEPVAIKFLLKEFSARPEARARFRREAVALAKLRHPSIVAVHDFGEHFEELYMVMELVRGRQLFDCMRDEQGVLSSIDRVISQVQEVLSVLEVAHAMGIVHRDLKPENVMLLEMGDRSERVKVLDFGLALMDDRPESQRLTGTSTVQGTPFYMSPEQCRGRDVGAPTDIYATGAMLYELLTGDPPFVGSSVPDIMAKHLFVEPPPMADSGDKREIPPGIEAVVRQALAKDPAERPTASVMRDLLAQALRGDDVVSQKHLQAQQRVAYAALSREQRALVAASVPHTDSHQPLQPAEDGAMARAVLWGLNTDLADRLRSALALQGVSALVWPRVELPDAEVLARRPAKVFVVAGHDDPLARLQQVRSHEHTAKTPVMVVDVDATATPALIRAGANDVAAAGATDESMCKQITRLVRRGR
ncbi:MAG: serine/threonine-protein kinase [Deltaproteobacteria bacterium]|nr:serine/threonine-protein kinase [Deltaproteobacteria bacterium]